MEIFKRVFNKHTYRSIDANYVFVGLDEFGIVGIIVEGSDAEYELRLEPMQAAAVSDKIIEMLTKL